MSALTLAEALTRLAGYRVRLVDNPNMPTVRVALEHRDCPPEGYALFQGRPGPDDDTVMTQQGVTVDEWITSLLHHDAEEHDGPAGAAEVFLGWWCRGCNRIVERQLDDLPPVCGVHGNGRMIPVTVAAVPDRP